jgi:hypothetical protein
MDFNYYMKMSKLLVGFILMMFFFSSSSSEIILQQKAIEREWLENNNEIM